MLLYLFTFTNNIPCELKLCPHTEAAQTKYYVNMLFNKNYNKVKAPEHHCVTMTKHTAMHVYD